MTSIASLCKELKQKKTPKNRRLDTPVAFWSEKDRYNDGIIKAFVIILKTKGCTWAQESGCSMCGYFNDSALTEVSDKQLLHQFQTAMNSYRKEPVVKIFTSGSFFDAQEISPQIRNIMLTELAEKTKKTAVESRPEYINRETIESLPETLSSMDLEVGIGLETATDAIRDFAINKGFTYKDYKQAATLLNAYGHLIKTYVLLKPPFLTEQQAIDESIQTISTINDITDAISLNPANVQRNTLVEYLWKKQYYRPPWLWSIIEVLTKAKQITTKRLQCDIVGGGSIRGPHNCKTCDKPLLQAIRRFSLSQNPKDLQTSDCDCKTLWKDQLNMESLSFGSLTDIQRGLIL